ncbi:MAG TPA: hypothetical protein VG960_11365 [Caulobacteraceae bacterium]|nr:hypothetical protein [Caulobacteraceae bacterium]
MAKSTKTSILQTVRTAGRLGPVAASLCLLGACANAPNMVLSPPPIDLTSPIAKDVAEASAADRPYPKFSDAPAGPPTDIRPASAWARSIYDTLRLRREQQAMEALYPQILTDTQAWADAQKARAAAPPPPPAVGTEDYAKAQRDRAKQPSPAS